ncbi:phosphatase 2C-like domain-containing protein [Scheffersomyces xylosifermentans]|uniref:phosphatase 2C-like domain-containing protein n=1 Tax=Scheffersomyces xylosifermentans TaxID=1304137 RepID=UPI00315D84F1
MGISPLSMTGTGLAGTQWAKIRLWRQGKRSTMGPIGKVRAVSSTISFTAIDRSAGIPMATTTPLKQGRLRIPLLKSPSHLGHFTSRVNRMYNEDKYSANVLELPGEKTVFNFNIFDGHGGDQCSTYLSKELSAGIENASSLIEPGEEGDSKRDELAKTYWKTIGGYWKRWYKHKDENFKNMSDASTAWSLAKIADIKNDLPYRLPLAFLKTDYDFFLQDDNHSGSTCTSALIETIYSEPGAFQPVYENYYFNRKTISMLTIAHVGDTSAILVDRTGKAHTLTPSHHPSNPVEAARLRKYAANFFMTDSFGEERFVSLANTRAFGDVNFKQMGVTAEPDITQLVIGDAQTIQSEMTPEEIKQHTIGGLGGDESFLILCTDGVTDAITDQEIADIVMVHFNMKGLQTGTPQLCAEEVIRFVEYVGGDDNATCLVIRLNGWGKWAVSDRTGELRQARLVDFNPRTRGG